MWGQQKVICCKAYYGTSQATVSKGMLSFVVIDQYSILLLYFTIHFKRYACSTAQCSLHVLYMFSRICYCSHVVLFAMNANISLELSNIFGNQIRSTAHAADCQAGGRAGEIEIFKSLLC